MWVISRATQLHGFATQEHTMKVHRVGLHKMDRTTLKRGSRVSVTNKEMDTEALRTANEATTASIVVCGCQTSKAVCTSLTVPPSYSKVHTGYLAFQTPRAHGTVATTTAGSSSRREVGARLAIVTRHTVITHTLQQCTATPRTVTLHTVILHTHIFRIKTTLTNHVGQIATSKAATATHTIRTQVATT